jgi:general stress protein CsbA
VGHAVATLLALDGESTGGSNSEFLAAISVVSIVFGWLLIAALWHFVFSARARRRRGEKDPPP